jgi:MerR family copper efflux transcriptional regulator
MVIGEAAKASGVHAKMLRYYESIGLLPTAVRTGGGYRTYGEREVETLRFIRRARDLGLSMERIKLLVGLWQDRQRPSREVKRIALEHVAELRAKIGELSSMCATLEELAAACHGDHRPECPILRDLEAGGGRMAFSDLGQVGGDVGSSHRRSRGKPGRKVTPSSGDGRS